MSSVNLILFSFMVATLSVVGITSAIIAASRWHWFVRAALILGLLSPLLVASALEMFITLLLLTATVSCGVVFLRVRQSRASAPENDSRLRFSLASVLLTVGLASILFAVGASLPEQNVNSWLTMVLIGLGGGLCVLLGIIAGSRQRWYVWWPIATLGSLFVALPLAWFDWFVISMQGLFGWPPDDHFSLGFLGIGSTERPIYLWFFVCPSVTAIAAAWRSIYGRTRICSTNLSERSLGLRQWAATGLLAGLGVLPVYALWVMVRLVATPDFGELPNNAYGEVAELGEAIATSSHSGTLADWDQVTPAELDFAVNGVREPIAEVRNLVRLPSRVPVDYFHEELLDLVALQEFRGIARALAGVGRHSILTGEPDEACRAYVDTLRLGYFVRAEGLMIDALVGIAITGVGNGSLYDHRAKFSSNVCQEAVAVILNLLEAAESYEGFQHRDDIWATNASDWHGRLQNALMRASGEHLIYTHHDYRDIFLLEIARLRLLAAELALQAYRAEHGDWPNALTELVPEYLPELLTDPFDNDGHPLRYLLLDDGYRLYSVGANRTDNGGTPPADPAGLMAWGRDRDGDLLLETLYSGEESDEEDEPSGVDEDLTELAPSD